MSPAPALFSLTYHAFQTSTLLLSSVMIVSPALYHTHIIRPTQSSVVDLYRETQFTDRTKAAFHSQIRSTGITLLSTSLFLLSSPNGARSYTNYRAIFFTSAAVVASHVVLLLPMLKDADFRNSWLSDRRRVGGVVGLVGVYTALAVMSLWAGTGWWPWSQWEENIKVGFDEKLGPFVDGVVNKFGAGAGLLFENFFRSER